MILILVICRYDNTSPPFNLIILGHKFGLWRKVFWKMPRISWCLHPSQELWWANDTCGQFYFEWFMLPRCFLSMSCPVLCGKSWWYKYYRIPSHSSFLGMELCETLAPHVVKLLMSSSSICHVRKKAALCVRRIIPAIPDVVQPEDLEPRLQTYDKTQQFSH